MHTIAHSCVRVLHVYHIKARIFQGVQFSQIGALQHFTDSTFMDASDHASACMYKCAYFVGL